MMLQAPRAVSAELYLNLSEIVMHIFKAVIFAVLVCSAAHAATVEGTVVRISDGDTLTILSVNNRQLKIRLYGIDAPERKSGSKWDAQPYSVKSTENLEMLCAGVTALVSIMDVDRYGRIVGVVYCQGVNVNIDQLQKGLAWSYDYFLEKEPQTPELLRYKEAQEAAKKSKAGLWRDKNPVPPWEWRNIKK